MDADGRHPVPALLLPGKQQPILREKLQHLKSGLLSRQVRRIQCVVVHTSPFSEDLMHKRDRSGINEVLIASTFGRSSQGDLLGGSSPALSPPL